MAKKPSSYTSTINLIYLNNKLIEIYTIKKVIYKKQNNNKKIKNHISSIDEKKTKKKIKKLVKVI